MNKSTSNKSNGVFVPLVIAGIVGSLLTYILMTLLVNSSLSNENPGAAEKQPIYWVAPMDPNYRRDKPGQSPMGMDLVPVYETEDSAYKSNPGAISVSPEIVNSLGVRTARAEIKRMYNEIKTVGFVKYDEDLLIHIHPRVQGWIERLYVKAAGDPVTKGEALYDIYSPELVNAQEEYVIALERKNTRLIKAAEDRLAALEISDKTLAQLKKTKRVNQKITFYAPQSGVIDNLNIREGFFVNPGKTIMSIGKLDSVWVEAEVFERQSSLVEEGAEVSMTLDYLPGKLWRGNVDYIYPTLDPKTRKVKVRLRFSNSEKALKPNMFADVIIRQSSNQEGLLVPREAVIRSGHSDRVVLALGNGRFKSVKVKLGRMNNKSIEILAGLEEGDEIVTSAQFLLDSESSRTSDFKRMNVQVESSEFSGNDSNMADAFGVINEVLTNRHILNISRGPIDKWDRPAATLDFNVSDQIDMAQLKKGMSIQFVFKISDGSFTITELNVEQSNNDFSGSTDQHKSDNE